jgi:phosphoglycolate phosphatase
MCIKIINQLLIEHQLPEITITKYRDVFTIPVENYYKAIGFDFEKKSFAVVGKEWMDEYERRKYNYARVHPAVTELIHRIHKNGQSQSILSAYMQLTLEELVEHFNLNSYFDYLFGASDIYARGKVEQGKNLMLELGLQKGESILIGDTMHDFEVAQEIGADCLLTAEGHQSYERLASTGCPVVRSISELL